MKRYHVNPATGDPARCHAEDPDRCPFGGAAGHTLDPVQCFTIYAQVMADHVVPRVQRRTWPVEAERMADILAWRNPAARPVAA